MKDYENEGITFGKVMKWIGWSILGIVIVCILWGCLYSVAPGRRGVMKRFNEVQEVSLPSGWGFKLPIFSEVIEMSIQTQTYQGEMDAYTNDMQNVQIKYKVNYELIPDRVPKLYENVGLDYEATLLPGRMFDVTKSEFGDWKAQQLISDRTKVVENVQQLFREKLQKECPYFQNVIVQITDLQFSAEFDKTNEEKEIMRQKALTAENETKAVQEKARQKVISAEADAKAMQIRAQALEKNPKLTEYEAVQKWDGKLPQYMMGGNSVPFINMPTGK